MANPQIEHGFVRIARELFDAMCLADLNGREWRVLMAIIRKTYGYNKKSDSISLSQLSTLTGIGRQHVCSTLKNLKSKNILIKSPGINRMNSYMVNKNYHSWAGVFHRIDDFDVTENGNIDVPENGNHIVPLSCVDVGPENGNNKRHKDNIKTGIFSLSHEIKTLRDMKLDAKFIKDHFLMRGIPETEIDSVMGKAF